MSQKDYGAYSKANYVKISGTIESNFVFSHKVLLEEFYYTRVKVRRLSGVIDYVPIFVTGSLISDYDIEHTEGKYVKVVGKWRSFFDSKFSRFYVLVNEIDFCEPKDIDENFISLSGTINNNIIFRTTPLGRKITEIYMEVSRNFSGGSVKKSYANCIAWGGLASVTSNFNYGDYVSLYGRIQSRNYIKKKVVDGVELAEEKTCYEISITSIARKGNFSSKNPKETNDSQVPSSKEVSLEKTELQVPDFKKVSIEKTEPQEVDSKNVSLEKVEPQVADFKNVSLEKAEAQVLDSQEVSPEQTETQEVDPQNVGSEQIDS